MILPAVFAFGVDPAAGPGLTFITMPALFAQMAGGQFFAILFFLLLFVRSSDVFDFNSRTGRSLLN